ncbi:eukaryotic translation initiation factor 3A [Striga asiatica]|uniref:Eukaryotic translation initiation factor 3A n=1 Tax=Striga asiatica TaxID=4170 RepID=A0A5A7PMX2_STRAF|nr:eukaryotic translation initiation factor 3A [Striga asiatica]
MLCNDAADGGDSADGGEATGRLTETMRCGWRAMGRYCARACETAVEMDMVGGRDLHLHFVGLLIENLIILRGTYGFCPTLVATSSSSASSSPSRCDLELHELGEDDHCLKEASNKLFAGTRKSNTAIAEAANFVMIPVAMVCRRPGSWCFQRQRMNQLLWRVGRWGAGGRQRSSAVLDGGGGWLVSVGSGGNRR